MLSREFLEGFEGGEEEGVLGRLRRVSVFL